jgi:hypothetical protein
MTINLRLGHDGGVGRDADSASSLRLIFLR